MNNFGLSDRDTQTIKLILNKYADVQKVHLFGSRAMGNFKKGSDIDLVIVQSHLAPKTLQKLVADFEGSTLPYFVDIADYQTIKEPKLLEHIHNFAKEFYSK